MIRSLLLTDKRRALHTQVPRLFSFSSLQVLPVQTYAWSFLFIPFQRSLSLLPQQDGNQNGSAANDGDMLGKRQSEADHIKTSDLCPQVQSSHFHPALASLTVAAPIRLRESLCWSRFPNTSWASIPCLRRCWRSSKEAQTQLREHASFCKSRYLQPWPSKVHTVQDRITVTC